MRQFSWAHLHIFMQHFLPERLVSFDPNSLTLAANGSDDIFLSFAKEEKLLSFYTHVGEFSKILIEGGNWCVFGRSGCR